MSNGSSTGFYGTYEEYGEYIAKPYLVDGKEYSPKCGMTICYSCNQLVYLGIQSLSIGERRIYDGLEGKFKTEKFRYITFGGEHWGMYQHWATACTGNNFRKISFEDYMEIKQLISPDKWNEFHQDYLQMKNQFEGLGTSDRNVPSKFSKTEGISSGCEQWPKDATTLSLTD
ncbi:hypothetical protein C1645_824696 [Glomus cerebriforme]|uniref:Uncharacterized protein n=1 Tax=Glomus cerebriforme TaxID=658196 RepID=A0A397T3E8_9GLOM|nr:hypothetical protein C1645_824696 [Glomus cerebriforme]